MVKVTADKNVKIIFCSYVR